MFSFRPLVYVSLFMLLSVGVSAQKYEYEMFMTGKKIGTLAAEKKVKGDVVMYTINTTADAQILWKQISNQTNSRIMFKNGVVTESYYEYIENGVTEKYCKITQSGNGYSLHHWKKGKYTLDQPSNFCVAAIYFNEPKDGIKLLDETWGEYVTVKKTGAGVYEFKAKDGDKNVYHYANGKITEAEFHTSIVTIKMKPKA